MRDDEGYLTEFPASYKTNKDRFYRLLIDRSRAAEAQNHRCAYCHVVTDLDDPDPGRRPTLEHLVPMSRGGRDHHMNHLMVCHACNHRRGSKRLLAELYVSEEGRMTPAEYAILRNVPSKSKEIRARLGIGLEYVADKNSHTVVDLRSGSVLASSAITEDGTAILVRDAWGSRFHIRRDVLPFLKNKARTLMMLRAIAIKTKIEEDKTQYYKGIFDLLDNRNKRKVYRLQEFSPYMTVLPDNFDNAIFYDGVRQVPSSVALEIAWNIIFRTRVAEAQNHRCAYCHEITDADHFKHGRRPSLEHVVPRARGGLRDHPLNHIMTCRKCNVKRGETYLDIEMLVPLQARVPKGQALPLNPKAVRKMSRRRYRRNEMARCGLRWDQKTIVSIETGESIVSYVYLAKHVPRRRELNGIISYEHLWRTMIVCRDAKGVIVLPGGQKSLKKTMHALENIAMTYVTEQQRLRVRYTKSLEYLFSRAATILETSDA